MTYDEELEIEIKLLNRIIKMAENEDIKDAYRVVVEAFLATNIRSLNNFTKE